MSNKTTVLITFLHIVMVLLPFVTISSPQTSIVEGNKMAEDHRPFATEPKYRRKKSIASHIYPFATHYPTIQELYSWYDVLARTSICQKLYIGTSWEDRPIYALKISDNVEKNEAEPEILLDGTIHAREWPSLQIASYFLWKLVEGYDTNPTIHWTINHRELFIVPLLNPDGYYYDGNGVLANVPGTYGWRKNARDNNHNGRFDFSIDGVDLNRNWNISWGTTGANHCPNETTYCGPAPFSEPEVRAYKEWILSRSIESYQTLHCFGGTLLLPWCFTRKTSPHQRLYRSVAENMITFTSILGEKGNKYSYGQAYQKIGYCASGGASDWIYTNTGALSLSFEIATGNYGFHPPQDMIMIINQDLFEACLYQARVANTDIGTATANLHPPPPYIVYGTVTGGHDVKKHTNIKLTDIDTGHTITTATDKHGYYEFNLATLQKRGDVRNHTFQVTVAQTAKRFTIGEEGRQRINMDLIGENIQNIFFIQEDKMLKGILIGWIICTLIIVLLFHYRKHVTP